MAKIMVGLSGGVDSAVATYKPDYTIPRLTLSADEIKGMSSSFTDLIGRE